MPLQFTKPERISLKAHPDFSEKWVQQRIIDDPAILGLLGDVELVRTEKPQPKAGRLDLLLHSEQLNRRYEVELMLGPTDPSHIIRTIEYWDIERRRYPAYDHVAVLVAEDITSRFLNVMALLAGSVPLIALQVVALKVGDMIALHFVHVLDQTELRTDDEYEAGETGGGVIETDRGYWDQRASPHIMALSDEVLSLVNEVSGEPHSFRYRKKLIDLVSNGDGNRSVFLAPKKTVLHIGRYVSQPEAWVKRFEDTGLPAALKRGNKAVRVIVTPAEFAEHINLLREFLQDAPADDAAGGQDT